MCPTCSQDFTNKHDYIHNKQKFQQHVEKCEKFNKFIIDSSICLFCKRKFQFSHSHLLNHVENCPENPDREKISEMPCSKCSKIFVSGNGLRIHEKYCGTEKPDRYCNSCSREYPNFKQNEYDRHHRRCQNYFKDVVGHLTCGLCKLKCKSIGKVLMHLEKKVCTLKAQRICRYCNTDFTERKHFSNSLFNR